jgi:hypothetical protein
MRTSRCLVAGIGLVALAGGAWAVVERPAAAAARPTKKIDPDADKMLREMTDYLAALPSFTVQTSAVDEVALKTGEKLQMLSDSEVTVERPNRLRSIQRGAGDRLAFYYDGKSMTILCKANNSYETAAAPATLDATIDKMRKQFDVDAPGADLLYSRPYDILMEQVTSGRFVGRETVDGVPANHLAFQGEEVDWQIWIRDGGEPLPLRFVIVSKTVKGRPEFAVQMSKWVTRSKLPASTFEFNPPAEAKPARSIVASCGAAR